MIADAQAVQMDMDKLTEVEHLFRAQVQEERWHPGAALAVYRHGHLVLLSAGKPSGSVAPLQLIERGKITIDDSVAMYWLAFGQDGKDA